MVNQYTDDVVSKIGALKHDLAGVIKINTGTHTADPIEEKKLLLQESMKQALSEGNADKFGEALMSWRKDIGFQDNNYIEISGTNRNPLVVKHIDFSNLKLQDGSHVNFDQFQFQNVQFDHCQFGGNAFNHSYVKDTKFTNSDFDGTKFTGSALDNVYMADNTYRNLALRDNVMLKDVSIYGKFMDDHSMMGDQTCSIQSNKNVQCVTVGIDTNPVKDSRWGPTIHISDNRGELITLSRPVSDFTYEYTPKASLSVTPVDDSQKNNNKVVPYLTLDKDQAKEELNYKVYTKKEERAYWKAANQVQRDNWKIANSEPTGCSGRMIHEQNIQGTAESRPPGGGKHR